MPVKQKPYLKLPKKYTKKILETITDLASKGLSRQAVLRTMKGSIDQYALTRYEECLNAFLLGRDILAMKVSEDIIFAAPSSYMDRKLLAQALNLFADPFDLPKISSVATALKAIAATADLYSRGLINDNQAQTIQKLANTFVELSQQTELKKEVREIKKMLKDKK